MKSLYEQLKDHPGFPKSFQLGMKYDNVEKYSGAKMMDKMFIDFLSSVSFQLKINDL